MSYIVSVETKKLTEAMIVAKFTEWCRRLKGLLECPDFKGVVLLEFHLDVAKGDVRILQFIRPE